MPAAVDDAVRVAEESWRQQVGEFLKEHRTFVADARETTGVGRDARPREGSALAGCVAEVPTHAKGLSSGDVLADPTVAELRAKREPA